MDRKDLERLPQTGWIAFLEGSRPGIPGESSAGRDFESLRATMQAIQEDPTTPETRLADWLLDFNPARTGTLVNLMLGGHLTGRDLDAAHPGSLLRPGAAPFRTAPGRGGASGKADRRYA